MTYNPKYFWIVQCTEYKKAADYLNGIDADGFEVVDLHWDDCDVGSYLTVIARRPINDGANEQGEVEGSS